MSEIQFRSQKGYLSVYDVADVIGISAQQMDAWIASAAQGNGSIGVTDDGKRVRKSAAIRDWYDGLWIAYGFRHRVVEFADWPEPPGKRVWADALHELPVEKKR